MLIFLSICRFGEPQVSQTCIYSKNIEKNDSEKSPNLHILKKNKKKIRLYVGLTGIDELVFDFFDFLSICRVGDFSLSFF